MAQIERVRESWSRPITADYLAKQASYGWKLVSIVWEREIESDPDDPSPRQEEAPYGLRVSADGVHLEENTAELEVLLLIMEGIFQDHRISQISETLNARDFRTRSGGMWTPIPQAETAIRGVVLSSDSAQVRSSHSIMPVSRLADVRIELLI